MTNKDYDDIAEILADLKQDIVDSMRDGEVDKSIKKVYQEKTEDIYDYEPRYNGSRYRHGESGSFADPINFKSNVTEKSNTIEYELHNERTSDCNCAYCRNKDLYLDYFIEEGIAGKSRIPKRPAYQNTIDELEGFEIVERALEKDLRNKGWK